MPDDSNSGCQMKTCFFFSHGGGTPCSAGTRKASEIEDGISATVLVSQRSRSSQAGNWPRFLAVRATLALRLK